jgi:hypothetical protein
MTDDALAEIDEAAQAFCRLCERHGVVGLGIYLHEKAIVVRAYDLADVGPICRRVTAEHDAPPDRTLN